MGITKTEGFSSKITQMADMFKTIGHPGRLSIILHLAKTPNCICNDIIEEIPLAQPTISRHLSELKRVGLIQGTIEGKNICYCINQKNWNKIKEIIKEISKTITNQQGCY